LNPPHCPKSKPPPITMQVRYRINQKMVNKRDGDGNVVMSVDAEGNILASPGGTQKAEQILWSSGKTVKSKVEYTVTYYDIY
jgi:hypothetical protein